MLRSTYTVSILEIPTSAWEAIRAAIKRAESPGNSYNHMFMDDGCIDLTHVAVKASKALDPKITWDPLLYPQAGDIVGWPKGNLGGQRRVERVVSTNIFYTQLDEDGYFVTSRSCTRLTWSKWARKALVIRGGKN